jgi:MFS superfamily sulfate permease-like transporter
VGLSLILLVQRLSRPPVVTLVRDPRTGAWGRAERHPGGTVPPGALVAGVEGPLLYANANVVKERLLELVRTAKTRPIAVVLDLTGNHELDLETLDMLGDLAEALAGERVELRLAASHAAVLEALRRAGVAERVTVEPTLDAAASAEASS